MRFEWDERKNRLNHQKHRLLFEVAQEVFADPFCLTIRDVEIGSEQRLWTIGRLQNLSILVVVHVSWDEDGEEITRMISARKATPRERRFYEEANG
jgi:uncharacterized DUF497 family protein